MSRLSRTIRSLVQCAYLLCTFICDAVWFLQLCLRSRAALAAENLFLRQQLTLYPEFAVHRHSRRAELLCLQGRATEKVRNT